MVFMLPIGLSLAIPPNDIHIGGKFSNSSGETIHMKMYASNNATGTSNVFLTGYGAFVHVFNDNSSQEYAHFNVQSNTFSNNSIVFTGNVTTSSNSGIIGTPISITSDASTGYTTLVFGYSNYTGIENVIIK